MPLDLPLRMFCAAAQPPRDVGKLSARWKHGTARTACIDFGQVGDKDISYLLRAIHIAVGRKTEQQQTAAPHNQKSGLPNKRGNA